MNCLEFEKNVVDLARGESLDASLKQRGTAHAQICLRCAGRLKNEQTISRGLRAVAKSEQMLSAPASIENALLAAFRAREEASPVIAPIAANIVVPEFKESLLQRFFAQFKWALVPAAVAALVLVAFAVSRVMQPTSEHTPIVTATATPAPTVDVESPAPEQVKVPMPQLEEPQKLLAQAQYTRRAMPVKTSPKPMVSRSRGGSVTVDVGEFFVDEPETISAKDFLVFDYARTLPPADSTQLMRVRMSRERLAPLGIPLPRETRNDNFVNADLLVGSDGVPRAIRVADR